MNTPLIDISPDDWAIIRNILQKNVPQWNVWAFGSRAKWTAKEYSDLDLAIITDKPLPLKVSASLSNDFSESDLPWKVDVVDWATTSETFRKIIEREKVLVQKGASSVGGLGVASKWMRSNLGSIAKFYSGGTPSKQTATYWGGTIPWISATSLKTSRIFDSDLRITEEGLLAGSRLAKKDDILLLVRGSALHQGIPIGIAIRDVAFNQDIKALRAQAGIDPNFLFYQLQGRRSELLGMVEFTGIGAGKLDTNKLQALPVELPYIEEQKGIVAIARSLDDRIDHNRALAANLEAIARQLFKSWFVDFDPVRAKAAGEKPSGLADDIAILFPDRFVESELGEIPEGWSTAHLADLIHAERGLSYKGAGLADRESGKSMHNLNSVLEGGGYKYAGIKFYTGAFKERHIAKAGDIIVANTEQGHKHRLIGFPAIIPTSCDEGLFSHHLYRVRLLRGAATTRYWLYYALMAPDVREQIIGHANGSTVNMLKPTGLQVPLVVLPLLRLCQQFDDIVKALHELIEASIAESAVLTNLRDLLLPRLISGKLRVEDAVSLVEETIA